MTKQKYSKKQGKRMLFPQPGKKGKKGKSMVNLAKVLNNK